MATYDSWGVAWGGTTGAWGTSWTHTTSDEVVFQCGFFDPSFFDTNCPPVSTGGGPGKTYRYFTPGSLSGRKKRRIDEVIEKETRLVKQFAEYQERGADADLINDLLLRLREVQLLILRLALESEAAERYIAQKREDEEIDDIKFILTVI